MEDWVNQGENIFIQEQSVHFVKKIQLMIILENNWKDFFDEEFERDVEEVKKKKKNI